MPSVTVVPADHLIIVDGNALRFDFPFPVNLHALQWDGEKGHMEWADDYNWPLSITDAAAYAEEVEPFVTLWKAEKARLEAQAAAAEAEYNSLPNAQARKRAEIRAGYDAALAASLTMPSGQTPPSAVEIALALEDFKAEDPEGWAYIRDIHTARRDQLLAAVEAADSPKDVAAVEVAYAV